MKREVKKVVILGTHVIGMSIAAHLANVGIESYVVNILPSDMKGEEPTLRTICDVLQRKRQQTAQRLQSFFVSQSTNLYVPEARHLIRVCDESHFNAVFSKADWVIEALVENCEFKKAILKLVETMRKPGSVISTATGEISVDVLASGFSEAFRQHFLGTHFFYPIRYRRLFEIIAGRDTCPAVLDFMTDFGQRVLGKSVIVAKDTPFFIAVRIAVFDMLSAFRAAEEEGMSVEEVDAVLGAALGRPESAIFRTADLIGLDNITRVLNVLQSNPLNGKADLFKLPGFVTKMTDHGWFGDRVGQGFYRKAAKNPDHCMVLDYQAMQYRPFQLQSPMFSSLMISQLNSDLAHRIRTIISIPDKTGRFVWKVLKRTLLFSAFGLPLIADDPVDIDRAMKWGYNWEFGPFEIWDAIGVRDSVARMEKEGESVPSWILTFLASGRNSIYQKNEHGDNIRVYDPNSSGYKKIPAISQAIFLSELKTSKHLIKSDRNANLIDLGDGIACLELHPSGDFIDESLVEMMWCSLDEIARNFNGLVIGGNQGDDFPVGLNYRRLLRDAEEKNWTRIEQEIRSLQALISAIRHCPKATVSAPFQQTLGAACELVISTRRIQAAAETYMGFADVHWGLLPSCGGIKELLLRDSAQRSVPAHKADGTSRMLSPRMIRLFKNIIAARISTNAFDARLAALMTTADRITLNPDRLIFDAKQAAMKLHKDGFKPPEDTIRIQLPGLFGHEQLMEIARHMKNHGRLSDYDLVIADKLAGVITGGDIQSGSYVDEAYILELERESFLCLIGDDRTQQRIRRMLGF